MDTKPMNYLRKRLSLLTAILLALAIGVSAVPAKAQEISPEHLAWPASTSI